MACKGTYPVMYNLLSLPDPCWLYKHLSNDERLLQNVVTVSLLDWSFKIEMKGEVNCQDHHKKSGLPQSEVKRGTGQTCSM